MPPFTGMFSRTLFSLYLLFIWEKKNTIQKIFYFFWKIEDLCLTELQTLISLPTSKSLTAFLIPPSHFNTFHRLCSFHAQRDDTSFISACAEFYWTVSLVFHFQKLAVTSPQGHGTTCCEPKRELIILFMEQLERSIVRDSLWQAMFPYSYHRFIAHYWPAVILQKIDYCWACRHTSFDFKIIFYKLP